ncbi:hypothetical protein VP01_322g5 [Puccinia sorghi]|uniref:Uncharacterized protein n=1 Tax=Puccinia sorghi TaxID=27349 RepID=A0A0L6V035_9BASI|nr:hypothetical protein VP01_322g5 [Puccinia sorghi]
MGSPPQIGPSLEPENNHALFPSDPITGASSRSRRPASNNNPSSSAAPYPPNQGSSSWGYDHDQRYSTQAAQIRPGAEYFHNYDVNHGEPMVQLQPFEWKLQPFHYYQRVVQWGLVPVPLDSNRFNPPIQPAPVTTPASVPLANPPYETSSIAHSLAPTGASRSSSIPSSTPGLARQEGSTRPSRSGKISRIRLKESASSSGRKSKERYENQKIRGPESSRSEPILIENPGAKEEGQSDKKEAIDHSSNRNTFKAALSSTQKHPAKEDLKEAKEYKKPDQEEKADRSNNKKKTTTEVSSAQEHSAKEDHQGGEEDQPDKNKEVEHLKNKLNPTTEVSSAQENSAIADPKGAKEEEEKSDKDEAVDHLSNPDTSTTEVSSTQDHPAKANLKGAQEERPDKQEAVDHPRNPNTPTTEVSSPQGHPATEDHKDEVKTSMQSSKQTSHSSFTNAENQGVWSNPKRLVGITSNKNKFELLLKHSPTIDEELVESPKNFLKQDLEVIPEIVKENSDDLGQSRKFTASNTRASHKNKYKMKVKAFNLDKGKLELSDSNSDEKPEMRHNLDASHEAESSSSTIQVTPKSSTQKFNPNNTFSEEHRDSWIRTLQGNFPQERLNLLFNSCSQTKFVDLISKFQTFIKKSPATEKVDEKLDLGQKSGIRVQEGSEKAKEFQLIKTKKDESEGKTEHKKEKLDLVESQESSSEIPEYEIKYLKEFPKTTPTSLSSFRILGKALNAGNKKWDFSIGIDLKNIYQRQQKHQINVLKCKTSELKQQCKFLMNVIGYPEGERRYQAIQAQIRQAESLEEWNKRISYPSSRPIREKLMMVDGLLQLSKPWPPERDLQQNDVLTLKYLFQMDPKLEKEIEKMINREEFKNRIRELTWMLARWNPHEWLSREDRMLIHQQALDVRLILLVGDCLQFGRKFMTTTPVPGTIRPEYAFEILITMWNHRKSSTVPWFETAERAWLLMDPERSKLYKERLNILKEYLADYQASAYELVSIVDKERKFQWYGTPWWHLGHILVWQDQGLDTSAMARLGNNMKLKKGQEELSPEQIQILQEACSKEEIPEDKKKIVLEWFEKEFHQSFKNKLWKKNKTLVDLLPGKLYSDMVTYYKARSNTRFLLPAYNLLIMLQEL